MDTFTGGSSSSAFKFEPRSSNSSSATRIPWAHLDLKVKEFKSQREIHLQSAWEFKGLLIFLGQKRHVSEFNFSCLSYLQDQEFIDLEVAQDIPGKAQTNIPRKPKQWKVKLTSIDRTCAELIEIIRCLHQNEKLEVEHFTSCDKNKLGVKWLNLSEI